MKICVLAHSFPRNEKDIAAAFMKGLCDGFVEAGNEVTVVTPYDRNFNHRGDPFKIVTYKYIWPNSLHVLGYSQTMEADVKLRKRAYLLLPFMLLFGTIALLKTIRKEKIDVINVHWILPNGLIALIASKLTGVPYVVTLPGTDAYLARRFKFFGAVARVIANNAAGILSNSSWILKRIMDLGVKKLPTGVISYPSDAV
ncbi:glycosyltransferase, partial [Candidatus Woesebacteria bacterium]|nr:glycosyltransferase [Candidatus Woesebacteria bacterium]